MICCVLQDVETTHQSSASLASVDIHTYHESLEHVLTWMLEAEEMLQQQEAIASDVQNVKQQFHAHEVRASLSLALGDIV